MRSRVIHDKSVIVVHHKDHRPLPLALRHYEIDFRCPKLTHCGGGSAWGAYNIGIFYWRPTPVAKALAKEWLQCLLGDDKIWDQNGFNDLARIQRGPAVGEDGLFWSYRGNLTMGILPVSLFCSGHTYFIQVRLRF